jgi:hypothetical protein
LLPVSADAEGHDVIAESYLPGAPIHNAENIGLEPVWPYDLIGDDSPMFELARRTYGHRPYVGVADWSFDPVQAARLGLGDEVRSTLLRVTERSQHSINGVANWDKRYGEFYVEQVGVVADARSRKAHDNGHHHRSRHMPSSHRKMQSPRGDLDRQERAQ